MRILLFAAGNFRRDGRDRHPRAGAKLSVVRAIQRPGRHQLRVHDLSTVHGHARRHGRLLQRQYAIRSPRRATGAARPQAVVIVRRPAHKRAWGRRQRRPRAILIGPALLAFRANMISRRAGSAVEHRMALAARTAPKSRPAAFRSLDHQAVGIADNSGRDHGAGCGCKTESQRDTQKDRSHHPVILPAYINRPPP